MQAVDVMRRLHQHRAWVTRNLLSAARDLSIEQLRRALPIGQGSIWKSLLHMYAAEYVWLGALEGEESAVAPGDLPGKLPGNQEGDEAMESLDALETRWTELNVRWDAWLASLSDASLDERAARVSTSSGAGKRFVHTKADIATHVCTHAHYTSAQVVNMLRQVGATLPDTMLITLVRSEQAAL